MIIGVFNCDPDQGTYAGEITTLTLRRTGVMFLPTEKAGDKEPDYRIVHDFDDKQFDLGEAWKADQRPRQILSLCDAG